MSSILPKNLQSILVNDMTTATSIVTPFISTSNLISTNATIPTMMMTGSLFATHTNNTIANIFTTNGNVGIATPSPGARLDVSGTIRATTSITTGSLFSTNQTSTNIVGTNISSTNFNGTTLSTANIYSSLSTINNLVGSNLTITSATISNINTSSVRITNGSLNATFNSNTLANIITTGGNVGINTTSPGSRLEINGTLKANDITVGNINFTGNLFQNGSAYLGSQWTTTAGNTLTYTSGNISVNSGFSSSFNSNTLGNIFTTGGNIGIGRTSPNYALDVTGHISGDRLRVRSPADGGSYSTIYNSTYDLRIENSAAANFRLGWNSGLFSFYELSQANTYMAITSSGNIGIGTTSPSVKLQIEDGSSFIGDSTYFSTSVPSAPGNLGTANGYRLFFDNTINATAGNGMPANKIVLHNNNFTAGFGVEGQSVTYHSGYSHTFYGNATNTSTYGNAIMMVNGAGRVGIMTTNPDTTLHINGNGLQMGTSTNAFHFFNSTGSLYMLSGSWNNGTYLASFTSTANVGIGNTSPGYRLDVSGVIRSSAGILLSSSNVFEFGHGISGKHVDAGKIGYNTWTTGLNIIGAGSGSDRLVYIYDHLQVATAVTIPNLRITGTTNITGNASVQATTNNYSLTSGALNVTGDIVLSGSELMFTANGVGAPTMNGRGAGSKIVLYPQTSTTQGDYAIGVEPANMWLQVPGLTSGYRFYQGTSANFVISTSGNVGIGNLTPQTTLSVNGPAHFLNNFGGTFTSFSSLNTGSGASGLVIGWNGLPSTLGEVDFISYPGLGTGGFNFALGSSTGNVYNNSVMRMTSQGNVGIGTDTPTYTLDVNGSIRGNSLNIQNSSLTTNGNDLFLNTGTTNQIIYLRPNGNGSSTSQSLFSTNYTSLQAEALYINSSKNIGIGTTSPSNTLDISGTFRVSSSRGNAMIFRDPVTGTTLDFSVGNRGGTQLGGWTTIDPNGGTTGSTGLFIYDGLWVNANPNHYVFNSTGLGIGTTNPAYLLDVNGTIDALTVTTGNLSTGTATIGTLLNTNLINYGISAQWVINGGGTVTWTGSSVLWSARLIIIPVKRSEYSTAGFMDIGCPTSGTITYYNSSNVTTTVTCTASGIPIGGWDALYYELTPGQTQTTDQTRFRLVDYNNTTWQPTSNWILIAVRNGDNGSLKWIPGNSYIASGATFNQSAIFNSNGVIGIGTNQPATGHSTTIPNALLSILSGVSGNNGGTSRISIGGDNNHYSAIEGAHTSNGATTLSFLTCLNASTNSGNPLTRMFIDTDGDVGIGTASPASKLHIFEASGSAAGANSGSIILDHDNSGGASSITFRSRVNRGSDYAYLQYQDSSSVGGAGETARFIIGIQNDADDHIILDPSGSVGVGTYSPGFKLHVNGNMRADDIYNAGWFRNYGDTGLYNQDYACHFLRNDSQYGNWRIYGNAVGNWNGLRFTQAEISLMAGDGATRTSGFHYNNVGWAMMLDASRNMYVVGDITAYWSDRRLKTNLQQLDNFDDVLSSLTGYTFNWNEKGQKMLDKSGDELDIGLIAQDVQAVIPQAVKVNKAGQKIDEPDPFEYLTINYDKIIPFLVEGYKSQRNELKSQKSEINELKSKIESLENIIQQLLHK